MYYNISEFEAYQEERQRELVRSVQNAQYEQGVISRTVGRMAEKAGRMLARYGKSLQMEYREPVLQTVPVPVERSRR